MNILLLGAAGFIGTNLTINLSQNKTNKLTLVDRNKDSFKVINNSENIYTRAANFEKSTDFDALVANQDVVYHLISTNVPSTSNKKIAEELEANIVVTALLLDACVRRGVKKIIFISSGGTVYGKAKKSPLHEEMLTEPISSYGIQKITIEKLLYLYHYLHGLDYRVVRLANPYGPFQKPNGVLGAVTTFVYKALTGEPITVFGDGQVVRDFIYIDDAISAIVKIADGNAAYKTFNLGSGAGHSIKDVLDTIEKVLNLPIKVINQNARKSDVPINYLDISRYEKAYGKLNPKSLEIGIKKTAEFMKTYYKIN